MARLVSYKQKKELTKNRKIDKVNRYFYISLALNIVLFALLISK